jgi:hypothetical protein
MRRILKLGVLAYLGAALLTRYRESQGELTCNCDPDCWCRQPALSLFRWVFPFGHET